jgi:hypothetical protein
MSRQPPKIDHIWTEGDRQPEIEFVLHDDEPVSAFTITLNVDRPDGTVAVIGATEIAGSRGKFEWLATSLQAGENQRCQMKIIETASSEPRTPPQDFLIDVKEVIA